MSVNTTVLTQLEVTTVRVWMAMNLMQQILVAVMVRN